MQRRSRSPAGSSAAGTCAGLRDSVGDEFFFVEEDSDRGPALPAAARTDRIIARYRSPQRSAPPHGVSALWECRAQGAVDHAGLHERPRLHALDFRQALESGVIE